MGIYLQTYQKVRDALSEMDLSAHDKGCFSLTHLDIDSDGRADTLNVEAYPDYYLVEAKSLHFAISVDRRIDDAKIIFDEGQQALMLDGNPFKVFGDHQTPEDKAALGQIGKVISQHYPLWTIRLAASGVSGRAEPLTIFYGNVDLFVAHLGKLRDEGKLSEHSFNEVSNLGSRGPAGMHVLTDSTNVLFINKFSRGQEFLMWAEGALKASRDSTTCHEFAHVTDRLIGLNSDERISSYFGGCTGYGQYFQEMVQKRTFPSVYIEQVIDESPYHSKKNSEHFAEMKSHRHYAFEDDDKYLNKYYMRHGSEEGYYLLQSLIFYSHGNPKVLEDLCAYSAEILEEGNAAFDIFLSASN